MLAAQIAVLCERPHQIGAVILCEQDGFILGEDHLLQLLALAHSFICRGVALKRINSHLLILICIHVEPEPVLLSVVFHLFLLEDFALSISGFGLVLELSELVASIVDLVQIKQL